MGRRRKAANPLKYRGWPLSPDNDPDYVKPRVAPPPPPPKTLGKFKQGELIETSHDAGDSISHGGFEMALNHGMSYPGVDDVTDQEWATMNDQMEADAFARGADNPYSGYCLYPVTAFCASCNQQTNAIWDGNDHRSAVCLWCEEPVPVYA